MRWTAATLIAAGGSIASGVVFAGTPDPLPCSATVRLTTTTGEPIPPGLLLVLTAEGSESRRVDVAGAGTYTFPDLPCGEWELQLARPRPLAGYVSVVERFHRAGAAGTVWDVAIRPLFPVTLQVRDTAGRPADAPFAFFLPRGGSAVPSSGAAIGLDGSGVATVPLHRGSYTFSLSASNELVSVSVDGVERTPERRIRFEVPGAAVRIEATIGSVQAFDVRVVDGEGDPVEGVEITVATPDRGWWNRFRFTDTTGRRRVTVRSLPVDVVPIGSSTLVRFEPESARVDEPDTTVAFVAHEVEGDLIGRVVDARSGEPVAGARVGVSLDDLECLGDDIVRFFREGLQQLRTFRADPDGRFRSRCVEGCDIAVSVDWPDGVAGSTRRVLPSETCSAREHAFPLEPGIEVRGRMVDRRDRPLEHVRLLLDRNATATGADGRFRYRHVRPGERTLCLERRGALDERLEETTLVLERVDRESIAALEGAADEAGEEDTGDDRPRTEDPTLVLDEDDAVVEIELKAVPGGRVCATVATDDAGFDGLRSLRLYRPGAERPRTSRMPRPADQADRRRICSAPAPPGDYQVQLIGNFRPVWLPGVDARERAVPVRLSGGETVDASAIEVVSTGRVRIELLGAPDDGDPAATLLFETADADAERAKWSAYPDRFVSDRRIAGSEDASNEQTPPILLLYFPVGTRRLRLCEAETACTARTPTVETPDPIQVDAGRTVDLELLDPAATTVSWRWIASALDGTFCWIVEEGEARPVVGDRARCSAGRVRSSLGPAVDAALDALPVLPARLVPPNPTSPVGTTRGALRKAGQELRETTLDDALFRRLFLPRLKTSLTERGLACSDCPEIDLDTWSVVAWSELEPLLRGDADADVDGGEAGPARFAALIRAAAPEGASPDREAVCALLAGGLGRELGIALDCCGVP